MKRSNMNIRGMFLNNRFLFVFSVIIALFFWLVVVISLSPEDTRVIRNVPVKIEMENSVPAQLDLQIFGTEDFTVDVKITGKRYVVGSSSIDEDDVKVVAQTAYVDTAGKHKLEIKATKADENAEFDIVSLSEESVEVFFDTYAEGEYPVVAEIAKTTTIAAEGWFDGTPVLSMNTVTVSGAATQVKNIHRVVAKIEIDKPMSQSASFPATIAALSELGSPLRYLEYNNGNDGVTVTVPIYKRVETVASVSFKNTPTYYLANAVAAEITPKDIDAGVPASMLEGFNSVSIGSVDFCELRNGVNNFTFNVADIKGIEIMDKSIEQFKVKIDLSDMSSKKLNIGKAAVNVVNVPEGATISEVTTAVGEIVCVGPESSLEQLSAEGIAAEVDLADVVLSQGSNTVNVNLSVRTREDCWVYGKYTVKITAEVN